MYSVIRFVIRCVAGLLFLAVVFAVIMLFAMFYQMAAGADAPVEPTALIFTMIFLAVTPGFVVLCVARGDGRWERWRAILLIQLPLVVVGYIWMREAEPSFWADNFYQDGQSGAALGMVNGLVFGGLMFLSAFLVALSLPSLRRRALGRPPGLVWLFVTLFLISLLPAVVLAFSDRPIQVNFGAGGGVVDSFDRDFFLSYLAAATGVSFLLQAGLVLWVALGASLMARALLATYFVTNIMNLMPQIAQMGGDLTLGILAYWFMLAMQGVGLALLYTPDVNQWLTGGYTPALAGSGGGRVGPRNRPGLP